ncbi:MAG: 2Fe-2S iron-sulfur cluster binding domain-containing protein [Enterobacterales bacterium]|nr:2Fe-2S iron-sulfur cluster binding domain-containing protein [Enterobacterales bacterium]
MMNPLIPVVRKKQRKKTSATEKKLTPNQQNAVRLRTIYQAKLLKSNITIDLTPDDILLEQIEKANVDISSACRGGNCGACQVKKISGKTITEVEAGLSDELKQQGHILTCTTRLRSNIELDI